MLENIKLVLGITDTSKDQLLQYYINAVEKKIVAYCNRLELPQELESIVEEIVINKMNGADTTGQVKSETMGDYSIEYNTNSDELSSYKSVLDKFVLKKVRTY